MQFKMLVEPNNVRVQRLLWTLLLEQQEVVSLAVHCTVLFVGSLVRWLVGSLVAYFICYLMYCRNIYGHFSILMMIVYYSNALQHLTLSLSFSLSLYYYLSLLLPSKMMNHGFLRFPLFFFLPPFFRLTLT
jgi:hypothetical protein